MVNPRSVLASVFVIVALLMLGVPGVRAADTQTASVQSTGDPNPPPMSREELDALLAPVALYSDNLLAQMFMASTYPLEIVQANRFAEQNPNLKGAALDDALAKQPWDASVKSLVQVPTVLKMMSDKVDWTQKIGDAYLDDPHSIAASIQRLRQHAEAAGSLKTNDHQRVVHQPVSAHSQSGYTEGGYPQESYSQQTIVIEQAQPDVMYVPAYNPTYAYGTWPYPAYPPYAWGAGYYPYYPLGGALAWGVGAAVTAGIWNNAWDWNNGNININNNWNNYSRWGNNHWNGGNRVWHHDGNHRGNVGYRDQATRDRFGQGSNRRNAGNRNNFRNDNARGNNRLGNKDLTGGRANNRMNNRGGRSNAGLNNRGGNRGNAGLNNRGGNRGNAGLNNRGSNRSNAAAHNRGGNRSNYARGNGGHPNMGNRSGRNNAGYNRYQGGRGSQSFARGGRQNSGFSRGGGGRGGYGARGGGGRGFGGGGRGGGHRGGGGGRGGGRR